MTSTCGSTLLLTGLCLTVAFVYIYRKVVPHDHQPLGNLADVKSSHTIYKEKFWDSSAYADLPFGKTHYFLIGPEDGEKIVFVHGISCPGACFPSFMNALAKKGYRILIYDHYGRGYSDSPGVNYSQDLYVAQLAMLLQKIEWTSAHILGYSLGGAITAHFVAKFPKLAKSVMFIAPTGLMTKLPPISWILHVPILGPFIFYTFGVDVLCKLSQKNFVLDQHTNDNLTHLVKLNTFMIRYHPGYLRSYFSTVLHFKFGGNDEYFARIEKSHPNKTMAIWGTEDKVVPFIHAAELQHLMPSLKMVVKENCGHSIVAEFPEFCVESVDAFLSKNK
ncbi:hypothetical protein BDV3_007025 [Batrachochytrium dendrobatidis]|uniref:AB hydrolase-1 domain-containing protein n=1 Tax=Batrachochytrium dendrobatidis (strain JEL423) TaxID=403673 RepID=A0A177WW32_BATDL|nr:hypothetical protein O5D80_007773 [Batrachochytrium dendrobatidis]KAK5668113.1 hypothetical protein QVD99_005153 [Batrachochytrium dendrobatidis]OAJ43835.1 hypothetical protein BDEG_27151 [Batrachochytrium dendrobatidis JEL423]